MSDFHHIDPSSARVLLIEAGPRILPAFAEDLSAFAQASLVRKGVEVTVRGGPVASECGPGWRRAARNEGRRGTLVWAARTSRRSPAAIWLDVELA